MSQSIAKSSRRNFLLAVGAGGAATAAGLAAMAIRPEAKKSTTTGESKQGRGYQETAHIRSYYNTAKI